jgi:hypothetical protein
VELKNTVIAVEKTKEVAVLDTQALAKALTKQKNQLEADNAVEKDILKYLAQRTPTPDCPASVLDDTGLRLWNSENKSGSLADRPKPSD